MIRSAIAVALCSAAAAAGWRLSGELVSAGNPAPAYDHQVAQHLASLQVPPELDSYFMLDLNELGSAAKQAEQLAETLPTAQRERQYIGLTGADPSHNLDVLRQARRRADGAPYGRAALIIVAPRHHRDTLTEAAAPLGTEIAHVAYP